MDLKQIEKLMAAMGRNGMKKIVIKEEGYEIELERDTPIYAVGAVSLPAMSQVPSQTYTHHIEAEQPAVIESKREGKYIPSPMIGTFYAASSPGAPPFVKVGDRVEEGSVICIIEAMKVMNEIKAGMKGVIAEILVKSGEPVEFGTKLFRIE